MKRLFIILLIAVFGLSALEARAGKERKWHFDVMGGVNLGGMAPMPIPAEIQEIKSYNPTLSGWFMGSADYRFSKLLGVSGGIRFDNKSMDTEAYVKNYHTSVIQEGVEIEGVWYGDVETSVRTSHLSMPIDLVFYLSQRWFVSVGIYNSYVFYKRFLGNVHDGYLRKGDPTGEKIEIVEPAYYDFSKDLRDYAFGVHVGGKWMAYKHFTVMADINWGLTDIFKDGFQAVDFPMYAVYFNLGVGYRF